MGSKLFILKIEESCLFDLKKLSFEMLAMGSSGSMIYFISMGHAFMLIEEVLFENIHEVNVEKFHDNLLDESLLKFINNFSVRIRF